MSILHLSKNYRIARRLREIINVFIGHGFGNLVDQIHLIGEGGALGAIDIGVPTHLGGQGSFGDGAGKGDTPGVGLGGLGGGEVTGKAESQTGEQDGRFADLHGSSVLGADLVGGSLPFSKAQSFR